MLDARRHNYLAGLAEAGGEMGLAWLDLSTGAFALAPTSEAALAGELARLMPGELLLSERLLTRPALLELLAEWKPVLTALPNPRFESERSPPSAEFLGSAPSGPGGLADRARRRRCLSVCRLTQQGGRHTRPRQVMPASVMQTTRRPGATSNWRQP